MRRRGEKRVGVWMLAAAVLLGVHPLAARAEPAEAATLIRARRVFPVSSPPIERGQVLVRGGKIVEVGKQVSAVPGSPGLRVIDVRGSLVPGFIDCGSDLGIPGRAADEFRELTPEIRAADAIDADHPELERALEAGVTAAAVSAGARNVVGGVGAVVRTGPRGARTEDLFLRREAFLDVSLADEAAAGNMNLRFSRPSTYAFRLPNTRMGTVFLARRALFEAAGRSEAGGLPRLLSAEGLAVVRSALDGALPLRFHAEYHQEVLTALRLGDEFFGGRAAAPFALVGAGEAWDRVGEIARRGVPVFLDPGTSFRESEPELFPRYTARLAALLSKAGAPFAFASGDGDQVAHLRERVAMGLKFGLGAEDALRALTLGAARLLQVHDRLGSIEAGKEADLVAIAGDPFDVGAAVQWVMVRGVLVSGEMEREL